MRDEVLAAEYIVCLQKDSLTLVTLAQNLQGISSREIYWIRSWPRTIWILFKHLSVLNIHYAYQCLCSLAQRILFSRRPYWTIICKLWYLISLIHSQGDILCLKGFKARKVTSLFCWWGNKHLPSDSCETQEFNRWIRLSAWQACIARLIKSRVVEG